MCISIAFFVQDNLREMKNQKIEALELLATKNSISFYENYGFQEKKKESPSNESNESYFPFQRLIYMKKRIKKN